jgi:hypothetical protein
MLDIKTNTNVNHPMEMWMQRTDKVPVHWLREQFGLTDAEILDEKTFNLLSFDGFHDAVLKLSQNINKEDAFNSINIRHQVAYGIPKYKSVDSYREIVRRKYRNESV